MSPWRDRAIPFLQERGGDPLVEAIQPGDQVHWLADKLKRTWVVNSLFNAGTSYAGAVIHSQCDMFSTTSRAPLEQLRKIETAPACSEQR